MSKFGKRGPSFGESREKVNFQSSFANNPLVPGPGAYENHNISQHRGKVMIATKLEDAKRQNYPGPGFYNHMPSINSTGKFGLSSYRNTSVPFIKQTVLEAKNMEERHIVYPGPGAYSQGVLGPQGYRSILSQYKSPGAINIGNGTRDDNKNLTKYITPGPGTYQAPSDFGHYSQPEKDPNASKID